MSTEYGLWSKSEGGFVEIGFYSTEEADRAAVPLRAAGEEVSIEVVCPCAGHEEQCANTCELCEEEEENG